MSTKALMTVEDFARLRTSETEDYELVEGELIILSSGTIRHNKLRDLLGHFLWAYFKGRSIGDAIGEIDCQLSDDTVRRPDVAIFLGENFGHLDQSRIPVPFAPDIAVEVLSPSEKAIDVNRKVRVFRGGVPGGLAGGRCQWSVVCSRQERDSNADRGGEFGDGVAARVYDDVGGAAGLGWWRGRRSGRSC